MKINFVFDRFHNGKPLSNIINISDDNEKIDGVIHPQYSFDLKMYGFDFFYKHNNDITSPYIINYIETKDLPSKSDEINFYPIILNLRDFKEFPWPLLYIDYEIVNQVNSNNVKILIMAPFAKADMVYPVEYIKMANQLASSSNILKLDNIIFMASDDWVTNPIKKYNEELNGNSSRYVNINFYERVSNMQTRNGHKDVNFLDLYYSKPKKNNSFLFLNNFPKKHRFLLFKFLEYKNILNDGLVTFRNSISISNYINNPQNYNDFVYPKMQDIIDLIKSIDYNFYDFLIKNRSIEKLELENDYGFLPSDPNNTGCYINTDWIENSYFSIIGEHQVTHNIHVSEKIYKMFYHSHPFIVYGAPGTLKYLHKIGYKTFPELFDESYDDMPESADKLLFIGNQILQYCGEDGRKKFEEKMPHIKETLEYNRNLFITKDFYEFWAKL